MIGPYVVERELGRGGMGRVLQVRHEKTGAVRALKVLAGPADPEGAARFRREAETLARAAGPGVVAIHESGLEKGQLWFVMDLAPGGSLRDVLARREHLPATEAIALVQKLAVALGRCHALGLVHRDVKPENVLLDEGGAPCLTDFGLVRDLGASRLTETNATVGTRAYMAPEQLEGRPCGPPADVWALGVLLYELVAGERPFAERSPVAQLEAMKGRRFVPLGGRGGAPRWLDAVIARALDPIAERRFADGRAFVEALASEAKAEPLRARSAALAFFALAAISTVGALAIATARSTPQTGATPAPVASSVVAQGPRRPLHELVPKEGPRLESGALAKLVALCASDADRSDLARIVEMSGLDPACDATPLRAIAWGPGPGPPAIARLARTLEEVRTLEAVLATQDGRAALASAVTMHAGSETRGPSRGSREYIVADLDARATELRAIWKRTIAGTLGPQGALARSATALSRPLLPGFRVLARDAIRSWNEFETGDTTEYVFVEQLGVVCAGREDELPPVLVGLIGLHTFYGRNGHIRVVKPEQRAAAVARIRAAADALAASEDPLLLATLEIARAADEPDPAVKQARRRHALELATPEPADPVDATFRHALLADASEWLATESLEGIAQLEAYRRALEHARSIPGGGRSTTTAAGLCRSLIRLGRVDELDRWLPAWPERQRERRIVLACQAAARDPDDGRARLAEIRRALEGPPRGSEDTFRLLDEADAFVNRPR